MMMNDDAEEYFDNDDSSEQSFSQVLKELKSLSNKRDPRSVRLAAVACAVEDVASSSSPSTATTLSPASMYASTIAALEGTLSSSGDDDLDFSTQVALLELLCATVPHVASNTLQATFSVASRVLRALVASIQSIVANNNANTAETQDELGGINATLRATCRASTQLLKCILKAAPSNNIAATQPVQQFLQATLLVLFQDRRPKVRKAAHQGMQELLQTTTTANPIIKKTVLSYAHSLITRAKKQIVKLSKQNQPLLHHQNPDLLHLLSFLEQTAATVLMKDQKLRDDIMELLVFLLQDSSHETNNASDFVAAAPPKRDMTPKIVIVNSLLSALMALLTTTDETAEGNNKDDVDAFGARVLASLIQGRPTSVYVSGAEEACIHGKILYGRLLLLSCQRVLSSSRVQLHKVGYKLLPLSVQVVLNLSRPDNGAVGMDSDSGVSTAQELMVELTQTFRVVQQQTSQQQQQKEQCWLDCLKIMNQLLLDQQQLLFRSTWGHTLAPMALLSSLLTDPSSKDLCKTVVQSLVDLHGTLQNDDEPSKRAIEDCLGTIMQSVGMETFWNWMEWSYDGGSKTKGGVSLHHSWLLRLIKSSCSNSSLHPPSLAFFQQQILLSAREHDTKSASDKNKHERRTHHALVIDFWDLFPCCCQNPPDISEAFAPLAQKVLIKAIGDTRYPELVTIICTGLRMLAFGVSERVQGDDSEFAQEDVRALEQLSTKLLPALFKLVETIQGTGTTTTKVKESSNEVDEMETEETEKNKMSEDAQRVQCVTDAIGELARLAPKHFLQALFKKIMHRLLAATQAQNDETEKICTLLGLARALVSSGALDEESISLLYRSLKPLIRTDESETRVQKKAYKVMAEICQKYTDFVTASERLEEITELLVGSILTCQVSARHMRLKCMALIVNNFQTSNKQQMDVIPKVVPELLLCLKDANGKTREAAYQLLLSMATVRDDMTDFFRIILAALGAQTPHMRSAAVMALSRLVFHFAREDATVQCLIPSLLKTVIVLFDETAREVIKSVVGFVRVSIAAMSPEQLQPLLPELVGGMLKYQRGKDRFRAKIKIILKKLVRYYGYDALMPLVPEGDTRLLTHMRKVDERDKRRKAAQRADSKTAADNAFDDMMESDEEDSDDGRTLMTGITGFTKMTGRTMKSKKTAAFNVKRSMAASKASKATANTQISQANRSQAPRLQSEQDGNVLDMLDPKVAKSVRFAGKNEDDSDMDDGVMEFDDVGRLVVPDDLDNDGAKDEENDEMEMSAKKRRISKFEAAKIAREDSAKRKNNKQNKKNELGAAYKSKKAGGDVRKKGQKYEPYAYVPLDGRNYTKKNRGNAVDQMSSVVRGGRKRKNR